MEYTIYIDTAKKYGEKIVWTFCENYPEAARRVHFVFSRDAQEQPEKVLAICDTDAGLAALQGAGCALAAFSHEENPGESLTAAPWLLLDADALTPEFLREAFCRHNGRPMPICATARCRIRELGMEDLPFLLLLQRENAQNPDGCFFPADCEDPENYLRGYIGTQYPFYGCGIYLVLRETDGTPLGIAGFNTPGDCISGASVPDTGEGTDSLMLSYSFRKACRGQGFAAEAVSALCAYARARFPGQKITACCRKDNERSIRLARRCGVRVLLY